MFVASSQPSFIGRLKWALLTSLVMLAAIPFCSERSSAATKSWTGAGTTTLWSDPANWQGGLAPVNGDDVVFGVAGGGDSFDNLTLSLTAFRYAAAILPEHDYHLTGAPR